MRRARPTLLAAALSAGLLTTPLAAQPHDLAGAIDARGERQVPEPRWAAVEEYIRLWEELGMFNGAVLVARGGEVLLSRGYGMASYELLAPNSPHTRFRVASLSKPITRAAIGRLWEQGKLDLRTRLGRFVPEYPHADRITIEQLVQHRSGVPHINDLPWYEGQSRFPVGLEELVARFAMEPLDFEPGTDRRYSNGGYALLALVIERASGRPYGEYLRTELLEPLGMNDTGHEPSGRLVPSKASGYLPGPVAGSRAPAPLIDMSVKIGGGSLYSTVGDLYRFAQALYRDDLMRVETWEALFPRDGEDEIYWTGRAPGFYAALRHLFAEDLTIVVLANNYAVSPVADLLPALVRGEPLEMPRLATDFAADPAVWERTAGVYRWPEPFGTRFAIRLDPGDRLVYEELDERRTVVGLFAQPNGTLFHPLYNAVCAFRAGASGEVSGISCTAPWTAQPVEIERLVEGADSG